jgi:hypothetical protein
VPDYEAMTDLEIRHYKTQLYWLRQDATPNQGKEIREEMIRAQDVINRRQRDRIAEFQRIAAETPGAVSTNITGVAAGAGAGTPRDLEA